MQTSRAVIDGPKEPQKLRRIPTVSASWWLLLAAALHGSLGLVTTRESLFLTQYQTPTAPDSTAPESKPQWAGELEVWLENATDNPAQSASEPITRENIATPPAVTTNKRSSSDQQPNVEAATAIGNVSLQNEAVALTSAEAPEPATSALPNAVTAETPAVPNPPNVPISTAQTASATALQLGAQPNRTALLGISQSGNGSTYSIVQSVLERPTANPIKAAEQRLNASLQQGALETDRLALTSIDAAAKRLILSAVSATSFQTSGPVVIRFIATPQGILEGVEVLSANGSQPAAVSALVSSLRTLPFNGSTPRPVQFTFELSQRTALASGRTSGTGLSIGPVNAIRQGAGDSPKVAVLPRKNQLLAAGKLNRERTGTEANQSLGVIVEQTVIDLNADIVDALTTGERVTKLQLLKRQVL